MAKFSPPWTVEFAQAMLALASAYRSELDDLQKLAYWKGLHDIPPAILMEAVGEAAKGEAFLPSIARLRSYADAVKPSVLARTAIGAPVTAQAYLTGDVKPLPEDDPRTWYACHPCKDTGWLLETKTVHYTPAMPIAITKGGKSVMKEQPVQDENRVYAKRCDCWRTNPMLQAQRTQAARFTKEKAS